VDRGNVADVPGILRRALPPLPVPISSSMILRVAAAVLTRAMMGGARRSGGSGATVTAVCTERPRPGPMEAEAEAEEGRAVIVRLLQLPSRAFVRGASSFSPPLIFRLLFFVAGGRGEDVQASNHHL
jgi:hypothetical protein